MAVLIVSVDPFSSWPDTVTTRHTYRDLVAGVVAYIIANGSAVELKPLVWTVADRSTDVATYASHCRALYTT